jgi:hypothetical protein
VDGLVENPRGSIGAIAILRRAVQRECEREIDLGGRLVTEVPEIEIDRHRHGSERQILGNLRADGHWKPPFVLVGAGSSQPRPARRIAQAAPARIEENTEPPAACPQL